MSQTLEITEYQMEGEVVYEARVPGYGEVTGESIVLPVGATAIWTEAGLLRMEFPAGTAFRVDEGDVVTIRKDL